MALIIHVLVCYVVQDILKMTYQTTLREARLNTAPLFSKIVLRTFFLASELFVLRPYFICHLTAKRPVEISWHPPQFTFRSGWLKVQLKRKILNCTSLFWILVNEGVGKRFFILSSTKTCINFYVKDNSSLARRV